MRKCYDCNHTLEQGVSFCSNCGRKIVSKKDREKVQQQKEKKQLELFKNQRLVSLAQFQALHLQIQDDAKKENKEIRIRSKKIFWRCCFFLLLGGFVVEKFAPTKNEDYISVAAVILAVNLTYVAIMYLFTSGDGKRWLTANEYYSIVHSRYRNGQHRCIKCGSKGIYKSTPYRSNRTNCQCSKCSFPFYEI